MSQPGTARFPIPALPWAGNRATLRCDPKGHGLTASKAHTLNLNANAAALAGAWWWFKLIS